MKLEYDEFIRGTQITITCTDFDGDESVGIPYGPETVYATDEYGNDFELTEDEIDAFTVKASNDAYDNGE